MIDVEMGEMLVVNCEYFFLSLEVIEMEKLMILVDN